MLEGFHVVDLFDSLSSIFKEYCKMRLSDLVKNETRVRVVEYDKNWKVSFSLAFLSKPELQRLLGRHTKNDFNPKSRQKEEILDTDTLAEDINTNYVKGWDGVTYEWLSTQCIIDLTKIENPKEQIPFSQENLKFVIDNVYGIDGWILENVKESANFADKKAAEAKN